MNGERVNFVTVSRQPNLEERDQFQFVEGTNSHFQHCFALFLKSFTRENIRIYHRQIETQVNRRRHVLTVDLADLRAFEELLYERIITAPLETIKIMEDAVRQYLHSHNEEFSDAEVNTAWQVALRSDELPRRLRELDSTLVSKMFAVSGIVITATKPYIKASKLRLQCKSCQSIKIIELAPGQNPYVPLFCSGQEGGRLKCPSDPYVALPDSEVLDAQTIKIQENPEDVPPGEIARTYTVVVDRFNVSRCVPGDRVQVTGVMLVQQLKGESLNKGYIYALDIMKLRERTNFHYSEHEEELFKSMARDPNIRQKIYDSIAPGIFGNEDIKKAIACMLFGGSRKHLPDKTLLRGDINVLLIGDPSTAKSQFLKFVEQTASIAVYTSGKGSSAAGLTASITKDGMTGEFQIEGGALVLADGGIVCIDEFDKMKPQDRVAIHEAMQQQTISVAKAGITTRLNSRTSVLAAANPIFGRYDELKQISDQIELQTTILSRFDCIFVVRDVNTPENNQRIANHILGLHQGRINRESVPEITFELLKKYIKYSKAKVHPRLSPLAAEKLQEVYVADRQKAYEYKKLTQSKNTIPITVRQLEAVIRLGEALARMKLRSCVGVDEINEAHHLFELSTLKTVEGKELGYEISEEAGAEVKKIEDVIKKRVCVGTQVSISKLMDEIGERHGHSTVGMAIRNMVINQEFREIKGKKLLIRDR